MAARTKQVCVRLSDAEHRHLKMMSSVSGLKMDPLIRSLIMGFDIKSKPPQEYAGLVRELSAIGNNINQLARLANATKSVTPSQVVAATNYARLAWQIVKEAF